MLVDSELRTAPKLWADLLREYPIVAVTGVHYWPVPHGQSSGGFPLCDFKGMMLDDDLRDGRWPTDTEGRWGSWWNRDSRQQFAIGSLVYVWVDEKGEPPFGPEKAGAKYFCYEQEMSLPFMTELKNRCGNCRWILK